MTTTDKSKRDVSELFGNWDVTDDGRDVWRQKHDAEILDELGIDRDDLKNEKRFEAAVGKIDEMARREGFNEHNGREYLSSVVEREAKQTETVSAYFDRAEQRRAAEAAESNARLEKLEASRAAERSQKQTQAPRASM